MTKKLTDCQSGYEIIRYCEKSPQVRKIVQNSGSHAKIYGLNPGEIIVCPNHRQDLGKGLYAKIIKSLLAIGVAAFVLVILL